MISADQIKFIAPHIKPAALTIYPDLLNKYMPKYGITTKARIAPFLANVAHESGSFNYTAEIASGAAYEGRKDLGNVFIGDGVKFKGRGLIQLTGRAIYQLCSTYMLGDSRLVETPSLLEAPDAATESACWFWNNVKGLNQVADKPEDWTRTWDNRKFSKFEWIVLRINGGQNGLDRRREFLARALQTL